MKIAIIGYSGSGKSTLAKRLGSTLGLSVLHMDSVGWSKGWVMRPREKARILMEDYLRDHGSWVIDGNWWKLDQGRRFEEADTILVLKLPRWRCLLQAWKRYRNNRGQTREDMAEDCPEKFDLAFVWWILVEGRIGRHRKFYRRILIEYGQKTLVLKTPEQVERFVEKIQAGS